MEQAAADLYPDPANSTSKYSDSLGAWKKMSAQLFPKAG